MKNFSELLHLLLKATGVKPAVLAQHLGYDSSYISKWLSGSRLPSLKNAEEVLTEAVRYALSGIPQGAVGQLCSEMGLEEEGRPDAAKEMRELLLKALTVQKAAQAEPGELVSMPHCQLLRQCHRRVVTEISERLYELCTGTEEDVDIIMTYPFHPYRREAVAFLERMRKRAHVQNQVRLYQLMSLEDLSREPELYCRSISMALQNIPGFTHEFYELGPEISGPPVFIVKDRLLLTNLEDAFGGSGTPILICDQAAVSARYESALQYIQGKRPLLARYGRERITEEKYIYDYMMKNQYRYFLRSMHALHLTDQMLRELCSTVIFNEDAAQLQFNMNKNSFEYPVTAVLHKATLMEYMFDGRINLFGTITNVDKEWRIRHIRHLIQRLRETEDLQIYVLENENPLICYGELPSTLYFCDDTMFSLCEEGGEFPVYYRFFSREIIDCYNRLYEQLQETKADWILRDRQVIELLEQGLKFIL